MSQSPKPFFQSRLSPLSEWFFVLPSLLLLALLALPILALLWRAGADGMFMFIKISGVGAHHLHGDGIE
jgi:ABC-type sulfate transport system permease component